MTKLDQDVGAQGRDGEATEKEGLVKITPEMERAGSRVLFQYWGTNEQFEDQARLVFCAMAEASNHPALRELKLEWL